MPCESLIAVSPGVTQKHYILEWGREGEYREAEKLHCTPGKGSCTSYNGERLVCLLFRPLLRGNDPKV